MTFFGMKDFRLDNVYSINEFSDDFEFLEGDVVVFFKSSIMDPVKIIEPKGGLNDLVVASIRKDKTGKVKSILIPVTLELLELTKDLVTKGPEAKTRSLLVNEFVVAEDISLRESISSPVFAFYDGGDKLLLRTLDVLRKKNETEQYEDPDERN